MEENPSLRQMRADKLERLAMLEEDCPPQLVDFGSHPSSPIKPDDFNFSLNFLQASPDQSLDESLAPPTTSRTSVGPAPSTKLNTKANKLLIYAAYFPAHLLDTSSQVRNQRSVVLCGTGHQGIKVEEEVKRLQEEADALLKELFSKASPVLPDDTNKFLNEFKLLPAFEQNCIGVNACQFILGQSNGGTHHFPSCSQLVFVTEMLRICGSYSQLMQLIVEVLTYEEEKKEGQRSQSMYVTLPQSLSLVIVDLLWLYYPILLLSLHDTLVVYERLVNH